MTMTRRIEWLIAGVLIMVLAGGLAIQALTAHQALQEELEQRNREAVAALAWALSQQGGDPASLPIVAAAHFERGRLRNLRLQGREGQTLLALHQAAPAGRAPDWFKRVSRMTAGPAGALVSVGGHEIGRLEGESDAGWAHDALWDICTRTGLLLALLVLVAGGLAAGWLHRWRRSLRGMVAQAQALAQGRFIEPDEALVPELRQLALGMNATARRMREVLAAQAEQVAGLQRQAQLDAVTGLPARRHFISQLRDRLSEPGTPDSALVIVRLSQLEVLNARLGREATDRVLCAIADVLHTYVERVSGTLAGRLNGSDFGLCLPVSGVANETAASIRTTLAAAPALRSSGAEVVVGAADGLGGVTAGAALAEADAALARAEAGEGLSADGWAGLAAGLAGARAWHERIADALASRRTRLGEFPVLAPDGNLLHLDCPMRMQLEPGGEFQPAARWLALARRSRLMPEVDLAAVDLALLAIAADGRPRAVKVSLAAAARPGFATEVARRLEAAPGPTRLLSLEWVDAARQPADMRTLAEAAALWHLQGARVGVAHVGSSPQVLPQLHDAGVDYIKVDVSHVREVASNEEVRAYAQGLVALIHGLGLVALAAGVDDAQDLTALWALGFDGATGPAVRLTA